jgi:hypothetical protein
MSYRTEFPDFPPETMPVIPAGFLDQSYHQDLCPNFVNPQIHLVIWVDFADRNVREYVHSHRFTVNCCDEDGVAFDLQFGDPGNGQLLRTDDWQAVLDLVEAERAHPKGATWARINKWEGQ